MLGTFLIWFWIFGSLFLIGFFGDYNERKKEGKRERKEFRHKDDKEKQQASDAIAAEYQKILFKEIMK